MTDKMVRLSDFERRVVATEIAIEEGMWGAAGRFAVSALEMSEDADNEPFSRLLHLVDRLMASRQRRAS